MKHDMTHLLEIQLEYVILKLVGVLERSHIARNRVLKLNISEKWADCFIYVQLAIFIHNTGYH